MGMESVETFVERWFDEQGNVLEVWFVEAIALFELRAGDEVLFASGRFVDVLHFCLRDEQVVGPITEPIDLSPEE